MKNVLEEFKEDLDFLLQAREGRRASEKAPSQPFDMHDYPDLLHIQAYLYRDGAEETGDPQPAALAADAEETVLPQADSVALDLNRIWDDFVLSDKSESLTESLVAAEKQHLSYDEPRLGIESSEPVAPPIKIAVPAPEREVETLADQRLKTAPETLQNLSTEVTQHGTEEASSGDHPVSEPFHYTQKNKDDTPAWKKFWTSMLGHAFIGVDIGTQSLKTVNLHKGAAGFSLTGYSYHRFNPISEELPEAERFEKRQSQVLSVLNNKFRQHDYITSALTGLEVIYRQLMLPKISKKELAEAVPWAVRKDLPYDIETAALGYELLATAKEGRSEKLKVGTVVAPSQLVAEHLQLYQRLGVLPAKLTAVPVAIWNVVHRDKTLQNQRVLVIEIGARRSHLVFVNQGVLDFHREITTSSKDFIEAISNAMFYDLDLPQLSLDEAVTLWETYGLPRGEAEETIVKGIKLSELSINLRPVLERLVSEIRRSIDYYREKFKVDGIDRIFISGGGACVPNLQRWLAEMLNESVEPLNPFQMAGIKKWEAFAELATCAPRFTVAVGLALDLSGGMNLLPVELQGMHRLHKIKKALRYLALVVVLGLGMSTAFLTLKMQQITAELATCRRAMSKCSRCGRNSCG
ncbi:MAG: type IV pilus assembly protein PilM [candidate division KSB1 bacterium]|nr:type IV pilus assembly protein PilM [candidate division KSB1 bacterium]